jgi:RNA polymerase sigma factor (sigma-70 family)
VSVSLPPPARFAGAREEKIGALFVEASETIESIVARRVRAPRATIEDACAFAWARLVARPDVVDGASARAIGWVARVAEREAWRLSALEHDVATPDALALLDHRPGDEDPVEQVAQREVLRALAELPPRQRRALELQAQGYTYSEIGRETGDTARTVSRLLRRGRDSLRGLLGGEDPRWRP